MNLAGQVVGGSIVIVEDDVDVRTAARLLLKRHFQSVVALAHPSELALLALDSPPVAILLDMNFAHGQGKGDEGLDALAQIRQKDPHVAVVLATAFGEVELAVEAMKRGATDFVLKPWQNEKLVATLTSAARLCLAQRESQALRARNLELEANQEQLPRTMVGESPEITKVLRMVAKAAPTQANILILGENGTGKELVAREIHRRSLRADRPFVAVDLGALPESLFESELFGHVRGAFTGASHERMGRFQAANGGTIFLDEIGNLPIHLQAKLLTVLEQRQVVPVGADQPIEVDIRVVAATNVARERLNDASHFRTDLLYRLNTVEIILPPLRERKSDIALLALHFVQSFAKKYNRPDLKLDPSAIRTLEAQSWPGNIRALRHALERAVIMSEGSIIGQQDFDFDDAQTAPAPITTPHDSSHNVDPSALPHPMNLEALEREAILRAMESCHGNISQMAKQLGLTRATLYRRMEKHKIG
jgi:DNA-binding NtrC family response regulator